MTDKTPYKWEIGMEDGTVYSNSSLPKPIQNPDKVIKISFFSDSLPPHILTFDDELKFVRLFGRGFIKVGESNPVEYVLCVVTNQFRFYLLQDGRVVITPKDYELRRI